MRTRPKQTKRDEPEDGSWVIAELQHCTDRMLWQRRGDVWIDKHGCTHSWGELIDPIDCLEPEHE